MGHVVVTGAAGFIGSAVVRALLADGRRVVAVLEPGGDARNLDGLDVERETADVCDPKAMRRILGGAESLFHLAAIYKVWLKDPALLYRVNCEGTAVTLLCAHEARVRRIVYTSSIAAVGLRAGQPSDETDAFNLFDVANDYILSKWLSERTALRFAEGGAPIVVVNPAFPFGPGDRAPTPTGKILIDVAMGRAPGYLAGGINAVDVDVVALGHLRAEEKGRVGERYLLGDHNVTFRELFEAIGRVTGARIPERQIPTGAALAIAWGMEKAADWLTHTPPTATLKSMQYAVRTAHFDVSKARRELDLPSRPLDDTLTRAVAWFREHGYLT